MDRPVNTAATEQAFVGGVDDRVGVSVSGDIPEIQCELGHARTIGCPALKFKHIQRMFDRSTSFQSPAFYRPKIKWISIWPWRQWPRTLRLRSLSSSSKSSTGSPRPPGP